MLRLYRRGEHAKQSHRASRTDGGHSPPYTMRTVVVRNKANQRRGAGDCGLLISHCGLNDGRSTVRNKANFRAGLGRGWNLVAAGTAPGGTRHRATGTPNCRTMGKIPLTCFYRMLYTRKYEVRCLLQKRFLQPE